MIRRTFEKDILIYNLIPMDNGNIEIELSKESDIYFDVEKILEENGLISLESNEDPENISEKISKLLKKADAKVAKWEFINNEDNSMKIKLEVNFPVNRKIDKPTDSKGKSVLNKLSKEELEKYSKY